MAAISRVVQGDTEVSPCNNGSDTESNQSHKLETIGRLASGVAHDFANILTLISGYAQILLGRADMCAIGRAELEEIRTASDRGATLISQLLQFARTQTGEPKPIQLNGVASDLERMLRPIIGETIAVHLNLALDLGRVLADPVEMDQVLMNLLLNARDAMPGGGAITIETENLDLDATAAASLGMAPGGCVTIRIADTGKGIEPEAMQHLFDPFFTTKPLGKGVGLGLNTVREIVSRRGGIVWATSLPGCGATFHVCLPRAAEHSDAHDAKPAQRPHQGRSELVLVVEDEESVRNLLTQVLTMRGYQVATAADGEEALEIFERRASEIQLVVTDVIMPKIGGPELAERLLEKRSDLPVIFMSGYPDDHLSGSQGIRQGRRFLRKPLLPDALCSAVREALDTSGHPFNL